jgi:DNA polymerase-3 subunit beta
MKLTVTQSALSSALGVVGRAVPSRSTLPVLSNILLSVENGRLRLSATNLEIGITTWIDADVTTDGAITLPAKVLVELVSQSPSGRIALTLEGDTMRFECQGNNSTIRGIHASEFPIVDAPLGDTFIMLPPATLKAMIEQCVFAAAKDDTRPILTGALVELQSNELTMCATDGFRLSKAAVPCDVGDLLKVIIPARALDELARLLADAESVEMAVTPSRNQAIFKAGDVTIVTELISGNFPDMARLIPKSHEVSVTVDASSLRKAVRRCNIFARDSAHVIRLHFSSNSVVVHGDGAEVGRHQEEVACLVIGDGLEINLNALYLIEALERFGGDVVIKGTSSTTPVLLSGDDDGFSHVIMPMHINGG